MAIQVIPLLPLHSWLICPSFRSLSLSCQKVLFAAAAALPLTAGYHSQREWSLSAFLPVTYTHIQAHTYTWSAWGISCRQRQQQQWVNEDRTLEVIAQLRSGIESRRLGVAQYMLNQTGTRIWFPIFSCHFAFKDWAFGSLQVPERMTGNSSVKRQLEIRHSLLKMRTRKATTPVTFVVPASRHSWTSIDPVRSWRRVRWSRTRNATQRLRIRRRRSLPWVPESRQTRPMLRTYRLRSNQWNPTAKKKEEEEEKGHEWKTRTWGNRRTVKRDKGESVGTKCDTEQEITSWVEVHRLVFWCMEKKGNSVSWEKGWSGIKKQEMNAKVTLWVPGKSTREGQKRRKMADDEQEQGNERDINNEKNHLWHQN